jgi:(S)-ureidoglycine aminohydrolase
VASATLPSISRTRESADVRFSTMYLLNNERVEVQEGDFMWLRAFCPQACYAGGPGRFRHLLYKDVNRHAQLSRQFV